MQNDLEKYKVQYLKSISQSLAKIVRYIEKMNNETVLTEE